MSRIPVLSKVSQHQWIWSRLELTIQTTKSCLTHRKNGICCRIVADSSVGKKHLFFFLFCWVLLLWMHLVFIKHFFSMERICCVWMHDVENTWKALRRHWVWGAEAQQIALGLKWSLQQQQQQHMGGGGKWDHTGKADEVKEHQGQRRWRASWGRLEFWGVVLSVSCLASRASSTH